MKDNTKQNMRGVALLVPLLLLVMALLLIGRSRNKEQNIATQSDLIEAYDTLTMEKSLDSDTTTHSFKCFDPNTADYRTMIEAGVPRNIAVSLLKWRETGKIFRIREDVALCYGMSDSLYFLLEPYIIIGEEYRIERYDYHNTPHKYTAKRTQREPHERIMPEPFRLDTVHAEYLTLIGFSKGQADLILRYRDIIGGYRTIEKFAECYAVGDSIAEALLPYLIFDDIVEPEPELVEINSADTKTLVALYGIGEKSASHIIRYRELLGGYYSVNQISELDIITEENFKHILQQIYCDSTKIKKIYINFASPKVLETHPYMTSRALKRLINKRESKGGWSTIEELIEDKIFSEVEARYIAPYLSFGTNPE